MNEHQLTLALREFHGTQEYYKLTPFNAVATEGIYFLINNAGAHWLLTECLNVVFSLEKKHPHESAYFFDFKKSENDSAVLICEDGGKGENNGEAIVYAKRTFAYTDFPLETIQIWIMHDPHFNCVALLPSEY